MEITKPEFKLLEKALFHVRLNPPFLLNDLAEALKKKFQIVPSYLDSPISVTAELLYEDGRIQQLSTAEQTLKAFPPTEWVWSVEPLKSGDAEAFVRLIVSREVSGSIQKVPFTYPVHFKTEPNVTRSFFDFFLSNWQWIAGTVLIPMVIYGFRLYWPKSAEIPNPPRDNKRPPRTFLRRRS